METVRFIVGALLIAAGVTFEALAIFGVLRMNFSLNRIHAAGTGDTLGLLFTICGCVVFNGINMTSVKLILALVLFWLAAPVASHLICEMQLKHGGNNGRFEDKRKYK